MAIKSDKWIKEMAESHGMIEPFQYDQMFVVQMNLKFYNINSAFVDPRLF